MKARIFCNLGFQAGRPDNPRPAAGSSN